MSSIAASWFETAPTTSAVFPLSRSIDFSLYDFRNRSPDGAPAKSGVLFCRSADCASIHPGHGSLSGRDGAFQPISLKIKGELEAYRLS
jgi:hypothetical protein